MKNLVLFVTYLLPLLSICQNVSYETNVTIKLNQSLDDELNVRVYPPDVFSKFEFVVPQIIPGTYMKVNYVKFYSNFRAFDISGDEMMISRKDNVFSVQGKQALGYLEYTVQPSLGNRKFWDNILPCGGTVITAKSALLNFQLVTGYFENFENAPFKIKVVRPKSFYGATSMQKRILNDSTDILFATDYRALIDQPVLYAEPDTTSFVTKGHKFNIAVHSEKGNNSALQLKAGFQNIMKSISEYSGLTSKNDYTFILYFVDEERLRGFLKSFGVESALEHANSSVYYDLDYPPNNNSISNYNHIATHEYFHTISPIGFHSKLIENFNFREPNMSQHVWLYEGATDYFAFLVNAKYLSKKPEQDLQFAISYSLKHTRQSMVESAEDIIRKNNVVSWFTKMQELSNFYQKGKLIAMGLDMVIMEKSNGNKRLINILMELKREYKNTGFLENDLKGILIENGVPGVDVFFRRYIEGAEIPPYEEYLRKLGYVYYPSKSKLPSYGAFNIKKNKANSGCYVSWAKRNSLGLKKGDSVLEINDVPAYLFLSNKDNDGVILNPRLSDTLSVTFKRKGVVFKVKSSPKLKKIRGPIVLEAKNVSQSQRLYRNMFFGLGPETN